MGQVVALVGYSHNLGCHSILAPRWPAPVEEGPPCALCPHALGLGLAWSAVLVVSILITLSCYVKWHPPFHLSFSHCLTRPPQGLPFHSAAPLPPCYASFPYLTPPPFHDIMQLWLQLPALIVDGRGFIAPRGCAGLAISIIGMKHIEESGQLISAAGMVHIGKGNCPAGVGAGKRRRKLQFALLAVRRSPIVPRACVDDVMTVNITNGTEPKRRPVPQITRITSSIEPSDSPIRNGGDNETP